MQDLHCVMRYSTGLNSCGAWFKSLWDLSSQIRDQTCIHCIASGFLSAGPPGKPYTFLIFKLYKALGHLSTPVYDTPIVLPDTTSFESPIYCCRSFF